MWKKIGREIIIDEGKIRCRIEVWLSSTETPLKIIRHSSGRFALITNERVIPIRNIKLEVKNDEYL